MLNDAINNKPDENKGVSVDYDNVKPEDFIKNVVKKADTHHRNGAINTKSQQNKPQCSQCGAENPIEFNEGVLICPKCAEASQ